MTDTNETVNAVAIHSPLRTGSVHTRAARPAWMGWLAIAVVAALPLVEAVRIVVQRSPVVLDGDEALLDLGARRAGHLLQLVGPYSRVGFHQPGPAVFYLLAPFVRVLGASGVGLFLGAIAISGTALAATVVFLWRLIDPAAALWAAAAIDCYCLCLRVGTLREPWNPYLVATPMVLFVVLCAAGVTGTSPARLWALAVGSYEVQTHIATAGFVVLMSVVVVVQSLRSAWLLRGRHRVWGPARVTGAAALVLIWLPPTVELWRDHPNNATLLWDYFTVPHTTPTLHQALAVVANALTIMPFGYHDYVLALTRSPAQLAIGALLLAAGMAAAVVLGVRRRQPLSLALAASALLGMVLGAISLLLAPAPLYLYFAVWLAFVPLSLLLAIGVALLAPVSPPRPANGSPYRGCLLGLTIAAVVVAGTTVRSDLRMAPIQTTTGAGPWPQQTDRTLQGRSQAIKDTAALSAAAERVLRPSDRWVAFNLGPSSPWPYVAGMVLALDERGVHSTVTPASWELYFGRQAAADHPVTVQFDLFASTARHTTTGTTAGVVDGYVLTYERPGSGPG